MSVDIDDDFLFARMCAASDKKSLVFPNVQAAGDFLLQLELAPQQQSVIFGVAHYAYLFRGNAYVFIRVASTSEIMAAADRSLMILFQKKRSDDICREERAKFVR